MRPMQIVLGVSVLMASLDAQVQGKRASTSLGLRQQPVIYVVAAGPQSEKFNQQMLLLSKASDLVKALHLAIVIDTTTFFALSWPGIELRKADQRTHTSLIKRFGSIEGKYEFLIIVIDSHGLLKTVSHDPMTTESVCASLRR